MQSAKHKSEPANDPWSFVHPLTSEDAAAMTALRSAVAGMKGKLEGITARAPFNGIIERVEAPEGVTFEEDAVGGISGWWAKPAETREGSATLHLHGGWFNWGTAQAFCNLVGHIALRAGAAAFIPDYRLAPEHPFPAAVKDAEACYRGLVDSGNTQHRAERRLGGRQSGPCASLHRHCAKCLGRCTPGWSGCAIAGDGPRAQRRQL